MALGAADAADALLVYVRDGSLSSAFRAVFANAMFDLARPEDKQGLAAPAPLLGSEGQVALRALTPPRRIRKRQFRGCWVLSSPHSVFPGCGSMKGL